MYKAVWVNPQGERVSLVMGQEGHKEFIKVYSTHTPVDEGMCFDNYRSALNFALGWTCGGRIEIWTATVEYKVKIYWVAKFYGLIS
jgi:hypothetical protein